MASTSSLPATIDLSAIDLSQYVLVPKNSLRKSGPISRSRSAGGIDIEAKSLVKERLFDVISGKYSLDDWIKLRDALGRKPEDSGSSLPFCSVDDGLTKGFLAPTEEISHDVFEKFRQLVLELPFSSKLTVVIGKKASGFLAPAKSLTKKEFLELEDAIEDLEFSPITPFGIKTLRSIEESRKGPFVSLEEMEKRLELA